MAYTQIGWQTGDAITAEKMNKMDNGWGVQNTQLFSETVTTVYDDELYIATLSYSEPINRSTLSTTFDGTPYLLPANSFGDNIMYGELDQYEEPDFTNFPLAILSMPDFGINRIFTQTAGTYSVTASIPSIDTSPDFNAAVAKAAESVGIDSFQIVMGETTFNEAFEAYSAGKRVYINFRNGTTAFLQDQVIKMTTDRYQVFALEANGSEVSVVEFSADSADGVISQ